MTESLKSAQLIHRTILFLSAAMLFFALSTKDVEAPYEPALKELNAIAQCCDEINNLRQEVAAEHYKDLIQQLKKTLSTLPKFRVDKLEIVQHPGTSAPVHQTCVLKTIFSYFQTIPEERLILYNYPSKTLDVIVESAKKKAIGKDGVGKIRITHSGKRLQISFVKDGLSHNAEIDAGSNYSQVRTSKDTYDPYKLIQKHNLVTKDGKKVVYLPRLKEIWEKVSNSGFRTAEVAIKRLNEQARKEATKSLIILGLVISPEWAFLAGPLILLCVLLYAFTHAIHIKRIATPSDKDELLKFPLLLLFPGYWSQFVALFSQVLLPTAASFGIWNQSSLSKSSDIWSYSGWFVCIACAITVFCTFFTYYDLRQRIGVTSRTNFCLRLLLFIKRLMKQRQATEKPSKSKPKVSSKE